MSSDTPGWACDTSVAIAALDPQHEAHGPCRAAVLKRRPALAGHAAFEARAVLTRLPPPLRLTPEQATDVLVRAFPRTSWLTPEQSEELLGDLGAVGIAGGAVYDAMVGRAAAAAGQVLLTRDRRAERTYRALDVRYDVVD